MYEIERTVRSVSTPHYLIHLNGDVIALAYTEEDARLVQKALNDDLELLQTITTDLSHLLNGVQ